MSALPQPPQARAARTPRDVAGWVARWRDAEIPVQRFSADELELWRLNEDAADARQLAESFGADPLMCLKVLAHVSRHRPANRLADAETMTAALVLHGISPFFRHFPLQPTIEDWLADQPEALAGLQAVLRRSHRAASFALGFAVHRMDHDAAVIHEAALLHDFAEMLLWCHEPGLALQIAQRQRAEPTLRSAAVQRELLGVELADIQQALMKAWHLPELLVRISDDHHADTAQVKNVLLAMRVARHSAQGWDNPAIPDDVADIGRLLNLAEAHTRRLLQELDAAPPETEQPLA